MQHTMKGAIEEELNMVFYALFLCICTVIFGLFLKKVGGGENGRKE